MKKLEASGYFAERQMKPGDPADPSSFKVRQGRVGMSAEVLTPADIDYIDRLVAESGCPYVTSIATPGT